MDINFSGKNALVTGAGKGIGREIAKALVQTGAKTFALSRTKTDLDSLKSEHPTINTIYAELADWDVTTKAVEAIEPIDLLVNNAGIAIIKDFFQLNEGDFDETFNVNLKAVFNVSQIVAKGMVERGKGGAIVNISSQSSRTTHVGYCFYTASKGGLESLTRVMALELGPHQIRTNCVNPTVVQTRLTDKVWKGQEDKLQKMTDRIPQGKPAEIRDVVHAVLYLLSDKADMINGAFLPVDGGVWIC